MSLVCRKCGGPHLTIKCGKEKIQQNQELILNDKVNDKVNDRVNDKVNDKVNKKVYHEYEENRERKQYFKTTYRVKISDLPNDVSEEEMIKLTYDWGHVVRVRVINYEEHSLAFIDFGYEEEAKYFIEALDRTPFEYMIISVMMAPEKSS